ncbi:MAG: ROK family protein [Ruthenibacterium sp.]
MGSNQKVDRDLMRQLNMKLVFWQIYQCKQATRPQLARLTGISLMAVGRLADELIERGLVQESDPVGDALVGRPAKMLHVANKALPIGGIYVDREGIRTGIVDPYGQILCKSSAPMPQDGENPRQLLKAAVALLQETAQKNEMPMPSSVGLACPGLVSWETGNVRFSSQLKWNDVNVLTVLKELLPNTYLAVDNDIKALALAESRFGAAMGYDSCVLLSIGSGIGAAAVIGGTIYRGKENDAGEIGHISINPSGRLCECGRIGCLQTNIADWAILQEARSVRPGISLCEIFEAYQACEPWANLLLQRVSSYICMVINLLANVYAPQAIVLCGSLITDFPQMRMLAIETFQHTHGDMLSAGFDLKVSSFGSDGLLMGATSIAFTNQVNHVIDWGKAMAEC